MGYETPEEGQWTLSPIDSVTCPMVQWDRMDSGMWGLSEGTIDSHKQSHLSHGMMGRMDSGIWGPSDGTVDSHEQLVSHGTVRQDRQWDMGPWMRQWTPIDSLTCHMVQWDRTDIGIWDP